MQAKKVSQFITARNDYVSGKIKSKRKAIEASGLSATTYYKYERMFGTGTAPVDQSIIDTHYKLEDKSTKALVQENAKLKNILFEQFLKEKGL